MKDMNVINCTAYSNGINSPLEYLNITTPAEFKVVMELLCHYDEEKNSATISRTGIARDTAMSPGPTYLKTKLQNKSRGAWLTE